jgi:hypothetical protein
MTRYVSLLQPTVCDSSTAPENASGGSRFRLVSREGIARFIAGIASALLVCSAPWAADEKSDEKAKRERWEFMTRKLDGYVIATEKSPEQPLVRRKEAVLRFSNPVRDVFTDSALVVWLSGERPVVVGSLWIGDDGKVRREFVSLSDQPLQCKRDGKTIWAPGADSFAKKPLTDGPKPADTPALQLVQMRRLAKRFTGDFHVGSGKAWEELRLMPEPLYRYTADKGAVEGAIFALAQSNDPEVLVVLELASSKPDTPATWSYGLARMSSWPLRVSLDGKEIWSVKGYWSNPRALEDPYQEAADGKYP